MKDSHIVQTEAHFFEQAAQNNVETVFLGNSHTFAFKTDSLEKAVHFGSYGESIEKSYYKLSYLLRQGLLPSRVILSYDLGLLRDRNINMDFYSFFWLKYYDINEFFDLTTNKTQFIYSLLKGTLFPYADGETDIVDYYFADKTSNEGEVQREDQTPIVIAKKAEHNCLDEQLSELGVYYFQRLIELCDQNKIDLVLVRFPVTTRYYADQSRCFSDETYYETIRKNYLGDGVRVLDYHNSFADSLFRDSHHLKGGHIRQVFTQMMKADLQTEH